MKLLSTRTLLAATLAVSASAQAGVVTVGSLTRDTAQTTITDTLNNRTWLGWDVTKGLTYAQTLAAIGTGGQFAGYSIARNSDAQLFTNAMLASHGCTVTNGINCSALPNQQAEALGMLVGESYYNYGAQGYDDDYAWFLSDNGVGSEVGLMHVHSGYKGGPGYVEKLNEWATIQDANHFGSSAAHSNGYTIGWMLYREGTTSNNVPEPGTLALTGLALLAATRLRRKA